MDRTRCRVRGGLVEHAFEIAQDAHEHGRGQRVHQVGHVVPYLFLLRFSMVPRQFGLPQRHSYCFFSVGVIRSSMINP